MHNQVVIIGGGPSGTLLALILAKANIDVLVLERMTKEYVLSRIRAGVLEWNTVDMLMKNGVGKRMSAEGQVHEGTFLSSSNKQFRIDFKNTINKQVMVYGQTEVTFDLYKELEKHNEKIAIEKYGKDGSSSGAVLGDILGKVFKSKKKKEKQVWVCLLHLSPLL